MDQKKIISSFGWKFFERVSVAAANFIITLVLARILTPDEYGIISLILIFTSLATVFVQGGFNTALIQKKNTNESDYTSILIFSMIVALILYIVLFFSAGFIEDFFHMENFVWPFRITALILFAGAINSIQVANLTKELKFKTLYKCSLLSMTIAAIVGIIMALKGFGVWSLVAQQVLGQFGTCLISFALTKWFPKGSFSLASIKKLVPYGSRILMSNLMVTLFLNLRGIVIGRKYSSADLAYFNRGKQFPQAAMDSINGTVQSVLLPVYSKMQDDHEKLLLMVRKAIRITSFIVFPMSIGLACVAKPLVLLLLTKKWAECIPFLQIFALSYILMPSQTSVAQAYKAIGDSKTALRIEIFRKTFEVGLLILSTRISIVAIAISGVLASLLSSIVIFYPNAKILKYSVKDQISDLLPILFVSLLMGLAVLTVGMLIHNYLICLIVEVLAGVVSFFLLCKLFRIEALNEVILIIKKYIRR